MPRPMRCRRVCCEPEYVCFSPDGISEPEPVALTVDEYEALRLVDYEKKTHEQCARQMDVSRTTVTDIYESARFKVADAIFNGKRLVIGGGTYRLCGGESGKSGACSAARCSRSEGCTPDEILGFTKGENIMRIAVTYENGQIFQHFGHTEQFKLYDVENKQVISSQTVSAEGSGHGALAGFLRSFGVDALICGGIGGGAQAALMQEGILLFGGVAGDADAAVNALLAGTLTYNTGANCNHHDGEGHVCGGHEGGHACGGHDDGSPACHGCH